jgi:hypothetical protein
MPPGFDSWDAWVAVGTLLLAAATGFLAWQTRRDVAAASETAEAALRSVEIAERALSVGIRPVVTDIEPREPAAEVVVWPNLRNIEINVPLRNVGSGLALLGGPTLEIELAEYTHLRSVALHTALPGGESSRIDFVLEWDNAIRASQEFNRLHSEIKQFAAEVPYTDMNGDQPTRTRALVRLHDGEDWYVDQIELFHGDDDQPFATLPGRSVTVVGGDAATARDHGEVQTDT